MANDLHTPAASTNSFIRQRRFWLKFFDVLCFLLVLTGLFQLMDAASQWEYHFVSDKAYEWAAIGGMVVFSFIVALLWQRSGKAKGLHPWLLGIIIFYVAYAISTYGFAKLMKTQFQAPQYVKESPINELNGFWLTWFYYGYSQTLAYILGGIQIGGSILLLFRKTRLAAIFFLLPVMVNICLVNHFYDISPLAYYNSAHYTFILLYLMFLDYDRLKSIFSYPASFSFNGKTILLNAARIVAIGGAFLMIYSHKKDIAPVTKLNGEWKVQTLTKNNTRIAPDDCSDSVWNKVYFEWRYGCLFRYNANKFQDKDLYGDYKQDEKQQTILAMLTDEKGVLDSTLFHYQFINDSLLTMNGVYRHDAITLNLKRLKVK